MSGEELTWPNGKRVAVAITVMYETWSPGKAPSYSVQATALKPGTEDHAGKAWSTYGGRVGVWRILRMLDRWGIPATFFTNARCAELYPDSVVQIVKSGHELGGHAIYQDQLLTYMDVDEQRETIHRSLDLLEESSGQRPTGWLSPVLAFTPETVGLLAEAGLMWHADVTYIDLPHRVETEHGVIAAVPNSDFTDNRVLKSNPRDLVRRPHAHVRLPARARADELARAHPALPVRRTADGDQCLRCTSSSTSRKVPDVWFARHSELAQWALDADVDEHTYAGRYFS